MNLHDRILAGFAGTQFWQQDVGPKTKQRILKIVREARLTFPPEGVRWFSRMLNRSFTFLSIDPPAQELIPLDMRKAGPDTYVGRFPVPATPRSLWLQYQQAYIIEVGPKVAPGVHQLLSASRSILPASRADFNKGEVTLVLKPGATLFTLETVKVDGWKRLKWYWRRKRMEADGYDSSSAVRDASFFGVQNQENAAQIFEVMRQLTMVAGARWWHHYQAPRDRETRWFQTGGDVGALDPVTRREMLRAALNGLRFFDEDGRDRDVHTVYDEINGLMKYLSGLEQQKPGTPVVELPDGSRWVILDKAGDKAEAALMRHCGNMGHMSDPDARLMSYRVPSVKVPGFLEPRLTFVYHPKEKKLSEMKGPENSKPLERWHPAIIRLLTKPGFVKFLGGYTYRPQADFNLNDLSIAHLAEVWRGNPELILAQMEQGQGFQRLHDHNIRQLEKLVGPLKNGRGKKRSKAPRGTEGNPADDEAVAEAARLLTTARAVVEADEPEVEDEPVDPQLPGEDLETFVARRAAMIDRLDRQTDQRQ